MVCLLHTHTHLYLVRQVVCGFFKAADKSPRLTASLASRCFPSPRHKDTRRFFTLTFNTRPDVWHIESVTFMAPPYRLVNMCSKVFYSCHLQCCEKCTTDIFDHYVFFNSYYPYGCFPEVAINAHYDDAHPSNEIGQLCPVFWALSTPVDSHVQYLWDWWWFLEEGEMINCHWLQ